MLARISRASVFAWLLLTNTPRTPSDPAGAPAASSRGRAFSASRATIGFSLWGFSVVADLLTSAESEGASGERARPVAVGLV